MVLDMSATETAPTFVAVASVSDVPAGWILRVTVGQREIALANEGGTFYALDNACSHSAGPLGDNRLRNGCLVECPWHNAVFDVRSGEVVRGPARKSQRTYPVKVEDGTVFVAIE
jgi:nitrite reductase/ring-hydroxylating ferredoxin subunit